MRAVRDAVATLGSTPWRRAPRLLLRRPTVFLAVAGACVVLVTATTAAPLFVSSTGTAALHKQIGERCASAAGVTFQATSSPLSVDLAVHSVATGVAGAGSPIATYRVLAPVIASSAAAPEAWPVQLMSRTAALDHVEMLEGERSRAGLWITDTTAASLGIGAGDELTLHRLNETLPLVVTGVYRDVASAPLDDYWCSQPRVFGALGASGDAPPPVALVDLDTFDEVRVKLDLGGLAPITWEVPTETAGLTLDGADRLTAAYGGWLTEIRTILLDRLVDPETVQPPRSTLPFFTGRSHAIRTTVAAGALPVVAAAALAGLAMVGAAASFWYDRRSTEVALLAARGVSPAAIGVKALLEALPAVVLAGVIGTALAYGGVRVLGPSTLLEQAAVGQAALVAVVALAAAVLVLGAVPAARARAGEHSRSRLSRAVGWVPWELGLGALSVIAYRRLGQSGAPVASGAESTTVDSIGLSFPLVFLATALVITARIAILAARRAPPSLRATAGYLAMRRLRAHAGAAVTLVVASAMAVGVLTYSAALTRSLQATLDAKARVFVGSDVAVRLVGDDEPPDSLGAPFTTVHRLDARLGELRIDVLAVDAATFTDAAFWDATFAGSSLDDLLGRLEPIGDSTPALLVGGSLPEGQPVRLDDPQHTELVPDIVARLPAFPGMDAVDPTIVVSQALLDAEASRPIRELWVEGDPDEILGELQDIGIGTLFTRQAREVVDQASFLTVEWTFAFMRALGFVSGAITVGGLTIYLDARRRARALAYAFARRMGMSRGTHRRALFAELSATVAVGCVAGVGIALLAVRLSYARIDPVPTAPPPPLLRLAPVTATALAVAGLAVSWIGAVLAQRRADADSPAEVLRAGT